LGSWEQHKTFLGSRELKLKYFREQVAFLNGNRGSNKKKLRDQGNMYPPWEGLSTYITVCMQVPNFTK
jgi:hypothetical protein